VEFVGLAGQAYRLGIVAGNYDWIGSVPAMILAAMVFVPYYWRTGVYTVPEYLGRRYNDAVRLVMAVVWLMALAFNLGIMLWVTGTFLNEMFGWPIMISIVTTVLIVGCYTIIGGLSAVVITDAVQLVLIFLVGGLLMAAAMFIFKSALFTLQDPFFCISWWSFVGSLLLTVLITFVTKPLSNDKLEGLVYRFKGTLK
jgi:SSS family solute:Na+ symporter